MPEDPRDAEASLGLLATAHLEGVERESWSASLYELPHQNQLRLDTRRSDDDGHEGTSTYTSDAVVLDVCESTVALGGRCNADTAVIRVLNNAQTLDTAPNERGAWLCLFQLEAISTAEMVIVELAPDGTELRRHRTMVYQPPTDASQSRLAGLLLSLRVNLPGRLGLPRRTVDY